MKFEKFIGQIINVFLPRQNGHFLMKLVGVEPFGIWVESQQLTNAVLQGSQVPSAEKVLVCFVPFQEIGMVAAAIDGTSLNEASFGVT